MQKQYLSIHLNDSYFESYSKEYANFQMDTQEYSMPGYLYFR